MTFLDDERQRSINKEVASREQVALAAAMFSVLPAEQIVEIIEESVAALLELKATRAIFLELMVISGLHIKEDNNIKDSK